MTIVCPICSALAPLIYTSLYHSHQFYCMNCNSCQQEMIQALFNQNQKAFIYMDYFDV